MNTAFARPLPLALAASWLSLLLASPVQAQIRWSLQELQTGVGLSFVTGINSRGDVVGMDLATAATNGWDGYQGGWLVPAGQTAAIPLLTASGDTPFVAGLKDSGQIVGHVASGTQSKLLGWTTQDPYAAAVELAIPSPDFYAGGINRAGVVIGRNGAGDPLTWKQGQVSALARPLFSNGTVVPTGINSLGAVVGSTAGGSPFLWQPASPSGYAPAPAPGLGGSFLSPAPRISSLTDPLVGITDRLNATVATDAGGPVLAFDIGDAYNARGRDWLRPQIDALPGGAVLSFANAVNDSGQIAGMTSSGRAAIATPYGTLTWQRANVATFSEPNNWSGMSNPALDTGPKFFAPSRFLAVLLATPDFANSSAFMDADAEVKSLQIGDPFKPLGPNRYGELVVQSGRTLASQGDVIVQALGKLTVSNGTIEVGAAGTGGSLQIAGTAKFDGLTLIGGPMAVTGSVTASGNMTASLILGPNATLVTNGLHLSGNVQLNDGTIHANGYGDVNGTIHGKGGLWVESSSSLTLFQPFGIGDSLDVHVRWRGVLQAMDRVENNVRFSIEEGGLVIAQGFTQNAGSLIVDGELSTPTGRVSLLGGDLSGNGRINGDLFVGGGPGLAVFRPGHSPGSFTINGDFQLLPGGELELEVARAADGTLAFDHVAARHIALNGTVHLKLGPGLGGASFQQLQLLDCGSGCEFGSGFSYVLDGSAASVTWTAQGLTLGIAPVPEPASAALWLAGLAGLGMLARRRRLQKPA